MWLPRFDIRLHNIVKFVDVFVFGRKKSSYSQPVVILMIGFNIEKYFSTNSSFDVTKLQKLWGNEIRPVVRLTSTFPFPISRNWCENISADRSFWSWIRIFVINFNVFTCRQKVGYFRQSFISSAGIDWEIIDNLRLKSPASNINAFQNDLIFSRKSRNDRSRISTDFFCAIVHLSQTVSLHFAIFFHAGCFGNIYVGVSMNCMLSGNFKAEWAVLPPCSNVADIPDDAKANAMPFWDRIVDRIN